MNRIPHREPRILKRLLGFAFVVLGAVATILATALPASAHSLDSSTIEVRIDHGSVEATVRVALETVDQALGTDYLTGSTAGTTDAAGFGSDLVEYLGQHLSATSVDGTTWPETFGTPEIEQVEGITSFSVVVIFDTADSDTSEFTIDYDAIIEATPTHSAVVVVTDSNNDISTAGIITTDHPRLVIVDDQPSTAVTAMVGYGLHHVLDGADHLLFLTTLLLPAPLIVVAGRWRRGPGGPATFRKVVHVITAFTIGHSITLIASAMGWVTAPGRPVEILIAVSIGVSAVHAIRPIAPHGEELIAVGFGLVHGLAFAGILSELGLTGSTSVLTLLAFNIGVELAQLLAAALTFPSIYVLSRTRFYRAFRVTMASIAFVAAIGWGVERIGLLGNPLAFVERFVIDHPVYVVVGLAALAAVATVLDRDQPRHPDAHPDGRPSSGLRPHSSSPRQLSDRRVRQIAG